MPETRPSGTRAYGPHILFKETMNSILESEEDLEEDIRNNIDQHRQNLKTLCHELCVQFDDKFATNCTMMDEEKALRDKLKDLQFEKNKRVEECNRVSKIEAELCELLDAKPMTIISAVPKESEMNALKAYVKKLEKMRVS